MVLETDRFGTLTANAKTLIVFPEGLADLRQPTAWLLLAEPPVWWLQSVEDSSLALLLVNPFHYVPEYRPHVSLADRGALNIDGTQDPSLLVIARRIEGYWTMNLREPLLLRPDLRLGRQIASAGEFATRHLLPAANGILRKCA